ncbi:DUF7344 domain-containing protein [Natrarchaeobius chitinivorans]
MRRGRPYETTLGEETFQTETRHHHLPKLAKASVIEYDNRQGTVRYPGNPIVEQCLELVAGYDLDRD